MATGEYETLPPAHFQRCQGFVVTKKERPLFSGRPMVLQGGFHPAG
jgi:hypothetical protein